MLVFMFYSLELRKKKAKKKKNEMLAFGKNILKYFINLYESLVMV